MERVGGLPFDPDSLGARRFAQTARRMLNFQQTVAVTVHAPILGRFKQDEPRSFKPGEHAEIPVAWAKDLVARGLASYEH
jgi:hypothetical protein